AAPELSAGPHPRLDRSLRRGSLEPPHQDRGATVPVHGDQVQDRNLALGRTVFQAQLCPAGFARRAEPNRRPSAAVVLIDPRLQHVHRVLLTSLVRHAPPFVPRRAAPPPRRPPPPAA